MPIGRFFFLAIMPVPYGAARSGHAARMAFSSREKGYTAVTHGSCTTLGVRPPRQLVGQENPTVASALECLVHAAGLEVGRAQLRSLR